MREGIAPSRVYLPPGPWETVLDYLCEHYNHLPDGLIQQRLEQGEIFATNGQAVGVDTPYRAHQWLWYYRRVVNEPDVPFDLPILYADRYIIVVDKPHFLATMPAGRYLRETVLTRLRRYYDSPHITPVHRLDRETAGVIMLSRVPEGRAAYQRLFQDRQVDKTYEAVAPYDARFTKAVIHRSHLAAGDRFLMRETRQPPNSETRIKMHRPLSQGRALYQLTPISGRKHQLRVHMAALGIPIVNDTLYPKLQAQRAADDFSDPLQLLARTLAFTDPFSGVRRVFHSRQQLALAVSP